MMPPPLTWPFSKLESCKVDASAASQTEASPSSTSAAVSILVQRSNIDLRYRIQRADARLLAA